MALRGIRSMRPPSTGRSRILAPAPLFHCDGPTFDRDLPSRWFVKLFRAATGQTKIPTDSRSSNTAKAPALTAATVAEAANA